MYLTITSTAADATDLGYLLHKHPGRAQRFDVSSGTAHVFYPEATSERCTVALLVEVDPVELVRGRRFRGEAFSLGQYVNDRPYAASSLLAVALGRVFRTAMSGRCEARPGLPEVPLPLEIHLPALPGGRGGELIHRLFEPLGWSVQATPVPLDETMPGWGDSRYYDVRLRATVVLASALAHLYVLLPVLDDAKHYWVSAEEIDKLLRAGDGWLAGHPARELITRRYLTHKREFVATAVARLAEMDDLPAEALAEPGTTDEEGADDDPAATSTSTSTATSAATATSASIAAPAATVRTARPLVVHRRKAVLDALRAAGVGRVVDLGCGEGGLLRDLIRDARFAEVLGVDVSARALEIAERRLKVDRMPDSQRARLRLIQSSLTYRDDRLAGFDGIVLMEVIEHLDLERLPALERTVFVHARPATVVVTTPNVEYNVRYENLPAGAMRHRDHRFEWTRAEFAAWADGVSGRTGYDVRFAAIGDDDPQVGAPTQMAVFTRRDISEREAS